MNKDMWHEQVRVLRRVRNLIGRDKGTRQQYEQGRREVSSGGKKTHIFLGMGAGDTGDSRGLLWSRG